MLFFYLFFTGCKNPCQQLCDEIEDFAQESGEEFSKESSVYNPYLFVSPFEDEIEYGSNSFISDLFFENSEFSYKMIASNNAGGSFFLDRNTTHSQKATLEPSSLFSRLASNPLLRENPN